jgi:hypothetical protein
MPEPEQPTKKMSGQPWRRRLAIGGAALAAILAGGVFALVVSGRSEVQPLAVEASPTPTATVQTPTPSAEPSPEPTATPTPAPAASAAPSPTPEPPAAETVVLEPVSFALNTVDRLSLRAEPGLDGERLGSLSADSVSVVLDGPLSADGYTWYQLSGLGMPYGTGCAGPLPTDPWEQAPLSAPTLGCPVWLGWVAAASLDGDPWLVPVSREAVGCPSSPVGTETYRSLTKVERLGCFGDATWTLRAFIAPIAEGRGCTPMYAVSDPPWLHACAIAWPQPEEDEYDGSSELVMHVHPDIGRCDFGGTNAECPFAALKGQWVEIRGHLDDPASRGCVATYTGVGAPDDSVAREPPPAPDPDSQVLECRTGFVATDVRVVSGP